MHRILLLFSFLGFSALMSAQQNEMRTLIIQDSIRITIDESHSYNPKWETVISFFALPNGNTTEQTMGKQMQPGDDWHFDIQHIRAQTRFIRKQWNKINLVVIYLENKYRSWPTWKQRNPDYITIIPAMIDSLSGLFETKRKIVYLNGHSGGGSLIFGFLSGVKQIPSYIKRISFLDSDYGYDSSYYPKFKKWLREVDGASLNVFAYNDSIALYNGKPIVSAIGGTWYRSHLFLKHLQNDFPISKRRDDSLVVYKSRDEKIQFYFKTNPDRGIYHTQQVGLNGFIHSTLCGTRYDSKGYQYYGARAYIELIE